MKISLALIFMCLGCLSITQETHAQAQVPARVFPIGGFEEGIDNNAVTSSDILQKLREGGMNTVYHLSGNPDGADAALANIMNTTQQSYYNWGGKFTGKFIGNRHGFVPGGEKRFFLVTTLTETGKFDVETEQRAMWWPTLVRDNESGQPEWKIAGNGRQLQLVWDGRTSSNNDGKIMIEEMRVTGKFVVDFVYRLTSDVSGNLLTVKMEAYNNVDQEITSLEREDQITYSIFNSEKSVANEKSSLTRLNGQTYAIHRVGGTSHALDLGTSKPEGTSNVFKIVVTITSNSNQDIFIRGVRIRTDMADKILRDDPTTIAEIKSEFTSVYNQISTSGTNAWKRVSVIGTAGEMTYVGYRVLAHIDNLFNLWSINEAPVKSYPGKRIYAFLAENKYSEQYAKFRSIYEDQNGYPPPALIAEEGLNMYYQQSWNLSATLPMPKDGMPYVLRGNSNYIDFELPLSLSYSSYKVKMQQKAASDGLSYLNAFASVNPPGKQPSRFEAHISTIYSIEWPNTEIEELDKTISDPLWPLSSTKRMALVDRIRSEYLEDCKPFVNGSSNTPEVFSYEDIFNRTGDFKTRPWIAYRPPLKEEIRSQTWNVIAHSAKGIFFNPFGSDGGGNIGNTDRLLQSDYDYDLTGSKDPLLRLHVGSCLNPLVPREKFTGQMIQGGQFQIYIPMIDPAFQSQPIAQSQIAEYIDFEIRNNSSLANSKYHGVAPNSWSAVMQPRRLCDGETVVQDWVAGWIEAFGVQNVYPCHTWSSHAFYWPHQSSYLSVTAPHGYYGFKERWTGSIIATSDVNKIAYTLSKLNPWQLDKSNVPTAIPPFHFETIASRQADFDAASPIIRSSVKLLKVERSMYDKDHTYDEYTLKAGATVDPLDPEVEDIPTRTADKPSNMHLLLGIHKRLKNRPDPWVTVLNKRTWPVYWNNDKTAILMHDPTDNTSASAADWLGAIDVRQLRFKVDISKVPLANKYGLVVYNVSQRRRLIPDGNGEYMLNLDPGEGALLHFTHYMGDGLGLPAGGGIGGGANNATRGSVAEPQGGWKTYHIVYESPSGIRYSEVEENYALTPPRSVKHNDSLVYTGVNCSAPGIASNLDSAGGVGIVFLIDSTGTAKDSSTIKFIRSPFGSSLKFGTAVSLGSIPLSYRPSGNPVITPAKNAQFWVAWTNPVHGVCLRLVDTLGTVLRSKNFRMLTPGNPAFVSITSHKQASSHYGTFGSGGITDSVHLAFQQGTPAQTGIYYIKAARDLSLSTSIDTFDSYCVSNFTTYSDNRTPYITTTANRNVGIVWEGVKAKPSFFYLLPGQEHSVIVRERSSNGTWSQHSSFHGFDWITELHGSDNSTLWPVLAMSDSMYSSSDTVWRDKREIAWHDPHLRTTRLAHYGTNANQTVTPWEFVDLEPDGMYPFLASNLHSSGMNRILFHHLTEEFASAKGHIFFNRFDYPAPSTEFQRDEIRVLQLSPQVPVPNMEIVGALGNITSSNPLNAKVKWSHRHNYLDDAVVTAPIAWEDTTNKTNNFVLLPGDTLRYNLNLRVGRYLQGDSAALRTHLGGAGDYVKIKVELRETGSRSLIAVLDSLMLSHSICSTSLPLSDSGLRVITGLTHSSPVYITVCAYRGQSNTFVVDLLSSYLSPVLDQKPAPSSSAPKISTGQSYHHSGSAFELSVRPNPARSFLDIELEAEVEGEVIIELYDVLGRKVDAVVTEALTQSNPSFRMDLNQLNPGNYFVRAAMGGNTVTKRVAIER